MFWTQRSVEPNAVSIHIFTNGGGTTEVNLLSARECSLGCGSELLSPQVNNLLARIANHNKMNE